MSYSIENSLFYYVFFIPKINFTKPLNGFGTFFTTIVKTLPPLYFSNKILIPPMTKPTPIMQSHAFKGRNNTSTIPSPNPIKQPGKNFLLL